MQYQAWDPVYTTQVPALWIRQVGNEHRMLFECRHPMLIAARANHAPTVLFDDSDDVRKLMPGCSSQA